MPSRRLDRRQGFLISATVHLVIVTLLANVPERTAVQEVAATPTPEASPPPRRVRLVPPRLAERLLRAQPAPEPARPRPGKDRISVGPPSTQRADRLELRRDEDLTAQAGGAGGPSKAGPPPPPQDAERSISRSLADLDRRLEQMGPGVVEAGAGRQMGPLFFDPEGADFTGWFNHFKNEGYRNWIVPEAVRFGFRAGHVDFEFWVERDGRMSGLRLLKSSGTPALDRAAQNALTGSRLLPLPADFGPPRVRMQVTFYYNEAPQG